jgi:hypothetical protein
MEETNPFIKEAPGNPSELQAHAVFLIRVEKAALRIFNAR